MSDKIKPASTSFQWPSIDMEGWKVIDLTKDMIQDGVHYGLGYKAHPLSIECPGFIGQDGHGNLGHRVDCSGFVRWAVYHATGQGLAIPDGSVIQHNWVEMQGFKKCDPSDIGNKDGAVRIAFLSPQKAADGIGHVMLLPGDGLTAESHGSTGPDRRAWGSKSWMSLCEGYVLVPPK